MKKNLNEQVSRIKSMMGLIMEQTTFNVSIENKIPIVYGKDKNGKTVDNTDWDGVHAIFSSQRPEFTDNLVNRVSPYLKTGKYVVTNVTISAKKINNEIVTKGDVTLTEIAQGQKPHTVFASRGSIGYDYANRHDEQVTNIKSRLKANYNGKVTTFGPYEVDVVGTGVKFRQTFFAVENSGQPMRGQISGNAFQIKETKPALSTSLDGIYQLNREKFKSNPGRYLPTKFNFVNDGKNITYTLDVTPHANGFSMLAFIVGDEALNNVFQKNNIPDDQKEDRILYTKNVTLLNPNNNQNENFKIMIVGF